jgi:hypothetical protein
MPDANGDPCRTVIMNVTIHPPNATSTPKYRNRKAVPIQVVRAAGSVNMASRIGESFFDVVDGEEEEVSRGLLSRNVRPSMCQNAEILVNPSRAANPIIR